METTKTKNQQFKREKKESLAFFDEIISLLWLQLLPHSTFTLIEYYEIYCDATVTIRRVSKSSSNDHMSANSKLWIFFLP